MKYTNISTNINKMFPQHLEEFIKTKTTNCDLGKIQTFQVKPVNKHGKVVKFGCDDNTYQLYPELLELVPRGFSKLEGDGYIVTLKGMPKFTGETPYDEDDVVEDTVVVGEGQQTNNDVSRVEFQTKANGKMGLATFFSREGIMYIFGGSKNVHIVRRMDEEIIGNQLHEKILRHIQSDIFKTFPDGFDHLIGQTLVGEYEDGCHIIYTPEPKMVYFIGDSRLPRVENVFPDQTHLPTDDQIREIRNMENTEGVVIVYYGQNGQVINRKKVKTSSYVLLRSAREKLCKTDKENYTNTFAPILETFKKRGDSTFLDLDQEVITQWFERIVEFAHSVKDSRYWFHDLSCRSPIGMARIWHEFVTGTLEKHMVPSPSLKVLEKDLDLDDLLDESSISRLKFAQTCPCPVLIVLRGPSGSGKSTLARLIGCKTFCTDDEFMVGGTYCFNPKLLKKNHNNVFAKFCEYMKDETNDHRAVLANTNLLRWEFERYSRFMSGIGGISVLLNMKIPSVDDLVTRSTHSLPLAKIQEQVKKFQEVKIHPQYYGVIFDRNNISPYRMKTVPHVTLLFCGGGEKPNQEFFEEMTGNIKEFIIFGDNTNKAGTCKVVETPQNMCNVCNQILHITTSVNEKFKPVDVGLNIDLEEVEYDESVIQGMIGPVY